MELELAARIHHRHARAANLSSEISEPSMREERMNAGEIVRDGKTGKAVVAETDITVGEILGRLAELGSVDALLDARPVLTREDVDAALRFAAGAVDRDLAYSAPAPGAGTRQVHEPAAVYGAEEVMGSSVEDALAQLEDEMDRLDYEMDLLRDLKAGLEDAAAGRVVPHADAMRQLRESLRR
jgi:uncharacterized protein (DUF433 family)